MSDLIDNANATADFYLNLALNKPKQTMMCAPQHSRTHCIECDVPIPEARQRMVRGVQTCVECQSQLEKRYAV